MLLRRLSVLAAGLIFVGSTIPSTTQAAVVKCAQGGVCNVGNIGPGGGRIVYDAGSLQWWGRYLEAITVPSGAGRPWSLLPDRKSTRLNSSHSGQSRMPSSA